MKWKQLRTGTEQLDFYPERETTGITELESETRFELETEIQLWTGNWDSAFFKLVDEIS